MYNEEKFRTELNAIKAELNRIKAQRIAVLRGLCGKGDNQGDVDIQLQRLTNARLELEKTERLMRLRWKKAWLKNRRKRLLSE